MILSKVVLELEELHDLVDKIFNKYFDELEDNKNSYIFKPLKSSELNQIQIYFDNLHSNLFDKIFKELADFYLVNGYNRKSVVHCFSQIAGKLQKATENVNECNIVWSKIYEARKQMCLEIDELKKEDLSRYRWVTESLKDNFIKKISSLKANINSINEIINQMGSEKLGSNVSQMKCLITGQQCGKSINYDMNEIFVGLQFSSQYYNTVSFKTIINRVLGTFNFQSFFANEHFEPTHISCEICQKLQQVSIAIFEISDGNPNVMFEIGLACALGKNVVLISKNDSLGTKVSDLAGIHRIQYEDLVQCETMLDRYLKDSTLLSIDLNMKKEVVY